MIIPKRVAWRALTIATSTEIGCLISDYSVGSHGYAQIGWNEPGGTRRMTTAHRASWTWAYGQIPPGQCINGHDSNTNLYSEPSGRQRCRQCTADKYQRDKDNWNARRRDRKDDAA